MGQSSSTETDPTGADRSGPWDGSDAPTVLLFMAPGENRRLLQETFDEDYDLFATDSPEGVDTYFDLCIVDEPTYGAHCQELRAQQRCSEDVFLPILLTTNEESSIRSDPEVWTVVDDVVSTPVPKAELRPRLAALLDRRRESLRLAENEEQLRETVEELRLKQRAIEAAPFGVSITDPDRDDNPVIYVNEAFEDLTEYAKEEILGQNCRVLQGPATDDETVDRIRTAIDADSQVSAELINYGQSGRQFWNQVDIVPVYEDDEDEATHFVGFQRDGTARRLRKQRLTVLKRVLRHNLRNDLSVVLGFTEMLQADVDDLTHRSHLGKIHDAASSLVELSHTVHEVETALGRLQNSYVPRSVRKVIESVVADVETNYSDRSVSVAIYGENLPPVPNGVQVAIREAIEVALTDTEDEERPELVVTRSGTSANSVEVEVTHCGSGISETEKAVYTSGTETPLNHADGVSIWLIDWVIRTAGGTVDVIDDESKGYVISMRLPTTEGTTPGMEYV